MTVDTEADTVYMEELGRDILIETLFDYDGRDDGPIRWAVFVMRDELDEDGYIHSEQLHKAETMEGAIAYIKGRPDSAELWMRMLVVS